MRSKSIATIIILVIILILYSIYAVCNNHPITYLLLLLFIVIGIDSIRTTIITDSLFQRAED